MKKKAEILAIILIVSMFAVAGYADQKEAIFPEIAALALGAWVMEKFPWHGTNLSLWLSPSLAALTGVIIVRYFTYSPVLMVAGAFVIVVLQLKLLRSAILPSISAAILPVITHSDSWYYPLSVCVLTGIIAFGRFLKNRSGSEEYFRCSLNMSCRVKPVDNLTHWVKLLVGIVAVSVIAVEFNQLFMIAPPLIVAFVELSKPGGVLRQKYRSVLFLLVFAAFSGVFWLYLVNNVLQWPIWISACLSTITVFLMYHAIRLPFPPAVAIALLPTIIPSKSLWSYPWNVLSGSAAFILISMLWFGKNWFSFRNSEKTSVIEVIPQG